MLRIEEGTQIESLKRQLSTEGGYRLGRSLSRTAAGFKTDLRSPLWSSRPREEILATLDDYLGRAPFEELATIDEVEREKCGPFSIMLPYKERSSDVDAYWHTGWDPSGVLDVVVSRLVSLIKVRLRPTDFDTAFGLMPRDTSLGLPLMTRDRGAATEYLKRAQRITDCSEIYPCVIGWRGQAQGLHLLPKQRVVWMFDHAETILGATILYPVLNVMKEMRGFSAWKGSDAVDLAATRILHGYPSPRMKYSFDYSGFDSSVTRGMLDVIATVLCHWFDPEAHSRIMLLLENMATISLVVPFVIKSGRDGGVPSGSVLTNLVDTLINLLAGFYCSERLGIELLDYEVLGDDSVFVFNSDPPLDEISEVMSELGLKCNPEKQWTSSRSIHFLQRWHSVEYEVDGICRGVRSPFRAVNGMMSYERFVAKGWSKYMDTARWIMQVENTKWDPRFQEFVRFMKDGDKILSAGADPISVFKRAGGAGEVRSVLSIASFPFNVSDPGGVADFATTRVLRSG
jgi:hypothetical protein